MVPVGLHNDFHPLNVVFFLGKPWTYIKVEIQKLALSKVKILSTIGGGLPKKTQTKEDKELPAYLGSPSRSSCSQLGGVPSVN